MEILLEGINLSYKDYDVFKDLNLHWDSEKDQYVMLLGPSGVGKSTLLNIIGGENLFYRGKVYFNNSFKKHPNDMHVPGYTECAIVGQKSVLRMDYTLKENLAYRLKSYTENYKTYRTQHLIQAAGLSEVQDHKVKLLSGGELQRAGIIYALADMPSLLLLDEPFNQLNAAHKLTMQTLIEDEVKEAGSALLHVTHNVEEILSHSGAIYILSEQGHLNYYKSFQQLYKSPKSPEDVRVFTFLNEINKSGNTIYFYPERAKLKQVVNGPWKVLGSKRINGKTWTRLQLNEQIIWVEDHVKLEQCDIEITSEIDFPKQ